MKRVTSYLYFLRFALLLWVLPLLLLVVDAMATRLYTHGIFLPDYWQQYLCNTFFLASTGVVSLITARLVILNGEDRFCLAPPDSFSRWLGPSKFWTSMLALVGSQVPAIGALVWIACLAWKEAPTSDSQLSYFLDILLGMGLGYLLAFAFWMIVNAFYLWSYDPDRYAPLYGGHRQLPHTIVFPPNWFGLGAVAASGRARTGGPAGFMVGLCFDLIGRLGPGFCSQTQTPKPEGVKRWPLWEGHCFAFVGFVGLLMLDLMLFPITAPLPLKHWSLLALEIATLVAGLLATLVWWGGAGGAKAILRFRIAVTVLLAVFTGAIWLLHEHADAKRFPIFSFVLILLTLLIWVAAAFAFLLDRLRVPIIAMALLYFLLGNGLFSLSKLISQQFEGEISIYDHYFPVVYTKEPAKLATPAQILKAKLDQDRDEPLIVIAATGGGLHAAGWTAMILGELESKTAEEISGYQFHKHILLLSTVSGGSLGAYSYLRELSLEHPFEDAELADHRMVDTAMCSSLDAVGWGLTYVDAVQSLMGVPLPRQNDSMKPELVADRSWALSTAFARNLTDYRYCMNDAVDDRDKKRFKDKAIAAKQDAVKNNNNPYLISAANMTLFETIPSDSSSHYPAFTMNTTAVESGERFLLANYKVPQSLIQNEDNLSIPASSFLDVYGVIPKKDPDNKDTYPDLPLAVAARLSATFPYISSVSRMPPEATRSAWENRKELYNPGFHFADGGYYDNDGVGSAIEFLCYAIANNPDGRCEPPTPTGVKEARPFSMQPKKAGSKSPKSTSSGKRVAKDPKCPKPKAVPFPPNILFIEIRDSSDVGLDDPNILDAQKRGTTALYNSLDQASAPLDVFWRAGHESVTMRNRRSLGVAISALGLKDHFKHIVIPYRDLGDCSKQKDDYTLSWSLTRRQKDEITTAATRRGTTACPLQKDEAPVLIEEAAQWISAHRSNDPPKRLPKP